MYIKNDESLPPSRIRIEEEREIKKRKYDNEFKQRVQQINAHFFFQASSLRLTLTLLLKFKS